MFVISIRNTGTIDTQLPLIALFVMMTSFVVGCGEDQLSTYPVEGRVVYEDGAPLPGGTINLETEMGKLPDGRPRLVYATGEIAANGTFQLITDRKLKGAVAGVHRVAIGEPPVTGSDYDALQTKRKPTVREEYASYETSGLNVTIEPKSNSITIRIERP